MIPADGIYLPYSLEKPICHDAVLGPTKTVGALLHLLFCVQLY
jgi:hypothetical protein